MVTWTSEENSYPLGNLSGWCNATLNSAAPTCPTGQLTLCQRSTMPETQRRISQNTQRPLHMEQCWWISRASKFSFDLLGVWRCSSVWPKTSLYDITDVCKLCWWSFDSHFPFHSLTLSIVATNSRMMVVMCRTTIPARTSIVETEVEKGTRTII